MSQIDEPQPGSGNTMGRSAAADDLEREKFHVTSQLCACGCATQLPSTIVAAGWKFIRGHKKGAGKVHNAVPPARRAPPAGKPAVTGMAEVQRFLEASRNLAREQMDECVARIAHIDQEKRMLFERANALGLSLRRYDLALDAMRPEANPETVVSA